MYSAHPVFITPTQTASQGFNLAQRGRTTRDFRSTLEALKNGALSLSDKAIHLYRMLNSYDKPDRKGRRKGFVYVSTRTLAQVFEKTVRTIERWLKELETVGLITRKQRPNTSSILYFHDLPQTPVHPCPPSSAAEKENVVSRPQKAASKMSFANSRYEERRNIQSREERHCSEAEEKVVVGLTKLGFDTFLARQFVARYGAEQVDRQITNLCLELKRGVSIRHYARWLYCAIQREYQVTPMEIPTPMPQAKQYQVEYVTDEHGYEYCRLTEIPDESVGIGESLEQVG
jgi:hypothetical protein